MIKKHIFEKITGLKPNNDVLNILNNPPYNQNSQNNIKLSLSTISKITNLAEMVSNHETSFFRDLDVYQIIKDMILRNSMKIWSAGCSYGQEAYSLAMLSENISKQQNFRILQSHRRGISRANSHLRPPPSDIESTITSRFRSVYPSGVASSEDR